MKQLLMDQMQLLDQSISRMEVENAIERLKINKSPGLDGLMAEFYKTFPEQLMIPHLLELFASPF